MLQSANDLFLLLLKQRREADDVVECFSLVVEQLHNIKFRAAISSLYPTMIAIARLLDGKVTEYIKQEINISAQRASSWLLEGLADYYTLSQLC